MDKRLFLASASLLCFGTIVSSAPSVRTFSSPGESSLTQALELESGGLLLVGTVHPTADCEADLWMRLEDPFGGVVWESVYGGEPTTEWGMARVLPDGRIVVGGVTGDPATGDQDAMVLLLDEGGAILWEHTFGGDRREELHDLLVTSEGSILVLIDSWEHGAVTAKLDLQGNLEWERVVQGRYGSPLWPIGLTELSDGRYAVHGYNPSGASTAFVAFLSPSGNLSHYVLYQGGDWDCVFSVVELDGGDLLMAGSTGSAQDCEKRDLFLLRSDSRGNLQWTYEYGTEERGEWFPRLIPFEEDYLLSSYSIENGDEDVWLLRVDDAGAIHWQKAYGWEDQEWRGSVPGGGGERLLVPGTTTSLGGGENRALLMELDGSGDVGELCSDFVRPTTIPARAGSLQQMNGVLETAASGWELEASSISRRPWTSDSQTLCETPSVAITLDLQPGGCPDLLAPAGELAVPASLVAREQGALEALDTSTLELEAAQVIWCHGSDVGGVETTSNCSGNPSPDGIEDLVCFFEARTLHEQVCRSGAGLGDPVSVRLTGYTIEGEPFSLSGEAVMGETCGQVPYGATTDRARTELRRQRLR